MEDDWDLYAVVRSCSSTTTAATSTSTSTSTSTAAKDGGGCQSLSNFEQDCNFKWFNKDPVEPRLESSRLVEDLHEHWKPFSLKQQQIFPISPLSVLQDLSSDQKQQPQQQQHQEIKQFPPQKQQLFSIVNGSKPSATLHHPSSRSKKRKNHSKKVCHVAAESLSSDLWSWRKYGQKPIKGSPYPRGYYRCSTSKGCMARKQVERNRSDPGMFIVTYTGDHSHPMPTHRNSLAGSTRHKPNPDDPKISPAPAPDNMESSREDFAGLVEEEDDDDDDFFAGIEDCLPDNSWLNTTNAAAATTAAGGG